MPSKRRSIRQNRKIKFSESNYVEKNYMQRGKAVIPVKLEKISDLYMEHDYKQMELADSVCAYIEEIAYMIPIHKDIILEIHCPKVDEEEQTKIKKSIKNNYGMEIDDIDFDISINNKKSIAMIITGLVLLLINILIEDKIKFFDYFLTVVWWVAIWDMIEIQFGENIEARWKRLNYQQLYDATITFVFDEKTKTRKTRSPKNNNKTT